jgi:hypothetical protein
MTNQSDPAPPRMAPDVDAKSHSRELLQRVPLVLLIVLCLTSCALIFILDPFSLDVDSVYQGF